MTTLSTLTLDSALWTLDAFLLGAFAGIVLSTLLITRRLNRSRSSKDQPRAAGPSPDSRPWTSASSGNFAQWMLDWEDRLLADIETAQICRDVGKRLAETSAATSPPSTIARATSVGGSSATGKGTAHPGSADSVGKA